MGGETRLARLRDSARLNAREQIAALCDADSFMELGTLAGGLGHGAQAAAPADALVGGIARIDGRAVVVGAEDFTVQGGSIGFATAAKRLRFARLARQERAPLVMLLDGAGERASNALSRYPYAPNDMQELALLSGLVPSIAVVSGSSAGHGAVTALLSDLVIMLEKATLFAAGPALVAAATGENVTKEELGGARMHAATSGVAHNVVADEREAFALVRKYLSLLPANAWEYAPARPNADAGPRALDSLLDIVPRDAQKPYDMRKVLELLFDRDESLEIQPLFGRSLLTVLGRLGGESVAVVANQPMLLAGSVDRDAADKAARFLQIADAFHLPVVFLADNPGVLSGTKAERAGTLRAAARMYMAQARLRVPKLHVTLRKAYGFGSSIMAMNPFDGQTLTLAFPGISLGGLPAAGGARAAGLDSTAESRMAEAQAAGAWSAGDTLAYDEIIDPRELRNALLRGLQLARGRRCEPAEPVLRGGVWP
ncbi:MAG: acetyl-CoA carboxylase carboxyltransferase subunit [Gammaproteobacteria bacterium]|nr:acetyl-CoA carboxylase carboxyltransferase subunit [Gammaproteobacteria bacterium]